MEPVTIIVTALATGAAAAAKSTVETAVKDAYAAFKALVRRKYGAVDVTPIEAKPESEARRSVVAEDLQGAGAERDAELLQAAQALIELIRSRAPETGPAIGVDLERVSASALRIREVESEGTGVRVRDAQIAGDIDIGTVRAGKRPNPQ
jgi:hypothetical protein